MRRPIRAGSVVAVVLVAAIVAAGAERQPAFVAAVDQATQLGARKQWAQAAKVCHTFAAAHARDPMAPLAAFLQGVILRKHLGQPDPPSRGRRSPATAGEGGKAREAFARAAVGNDTLGPAFRVAARAWLARLQMEHLDVALRKYYVHKVEYPDKLDALVGRKLATPEDLLDPWGKPFAYKTGRLLIAPKVPRQTYALTCTTIAGDSRQLKRHLLKDTDELQQRYQLRAIVPTTPLKAIVIEVGGSGKRLTVAAGARLGSATVTHIAHGLAVLIDGEQVAVLTLGRPKR